MSHRNLSRAALQTWEASAAAWNESVGRDGNLYWKALQAPCLDRLLADHLDAHRNRGGGTACRALELSTGNGIGARWLAARGAHVTATDGSAGMLEGARSHGDADGRITYGKLDVTEEADFVSLITGQAGASDGFDIILMNMSMHDVATLEPLAKYLPQLLKTDGMFVAQLLHPIFMTSTHSKSLQLSFNPATGERVVVRGKLVKEYLHVEPFNLTFDGKRSTPLTHFHRPLHELFATFFKAGLVMDALEEPSFTEEHETPQRIESTANFTQLPALMAFRLRKAH
ncbi:methyltransferase type 11 [Cordyceps javanica]|uniref:Methyltransferase type 11 n=1 Tax=Cordyceps javanica TaxID=43265 RepID=A0A545VGJ4_9HYPO|nr:methyltransferase type 11 [Cordyceps javanica]TQW12008.1 methyltransferase type 11 [Cordyceps javanica]